MRPRSSINAVQDARADLGSRLRELRQQAQLTGRQLAEALSWPPSKVSKLENGRQTPTEADIVGWTQVTGAQDEAPQLLTSLRTLESRHAEWARQIKGGLRIHQDRLAELDARTRLFRAFEPTFIPGLLQTAEYARARFEQSVAVFGVPNDIDDAVMVRVRRQDILYRADKRFHFILTEAALRYRLCATEPTLGQLDRLVSLSQLPNVRIGVIGFRSRYIVAPAHGFWLLDSDRVMVETVSAELNLTQEHEIELYSTVFDRMAAVASYGRQARAIITQVVDDLAAELPVDGA